MDISMKLDLSHESSDHKRAGLPGSYLQHAACNRHNETSWGGAKQAPEGEPATVPLGLRCRHPEEWMLATRYPDSVRCSSCNGWNPSNARRW
jgi:hypothetical protein